MRSRLPRFSKFKKAFLPSDGRVHASVGGNQILLLKDGNEAFPAMLDAIAQAEGEVLLEMYWFDSDEVGHRFADALSACAKRGVRVRVVYDSIGSYGVDDRMFAAMRDAGCEVREYNPVRRRFFIPTQLANRRDHRKSLTVDAHITFTGGINIADVWAADKAGGAQWRDDVIRIEGPAALQMREIFYDLWNHFDARRLDLAPPRSRITERKHEGAVRILTNRLRSERRAIRQAYLHAIRRATKSIYISNSYFVPDWSIRQALFDAAGRGVDVRVLTAGLSDNMLTRFASRRIYALLMRHGVHVHEWTRSVLHAKTAVIDGRWCTVGTYNLDYRSWRFNLEVNAMIDDESFGATMSERFVRDLSLSAAVDPQTWRARPWIERIFEFLAWRLRKLL